MRNFFCVCNCVKLLYDLFKNCKHSSFSWEKTLLYPYFLTQPNTAQVQGFYPCTWAVLFKKLWTSLAEVLPASLPTSFIFKGASVFYDQSNVAFFDQVIGNKNFYSKIRLHYCFLQGSAIQHCYFPTSSQ